ncbi:MAG: NADH-quinone oxidoreductase subunit C [Candidatus Korarchaeota archaeon]|nr:NADH-quinone oxidoreductase subunit C [Candidatus Korarchaeota archaeon]
MNFEELKAKIESELGDLGAEVSGREPNVIDIKVDKEKIVEAAKRLKSMGFDHVKAVTAVDFPKERFEVIYHASSYSDLELAYFIVNLRTSLPYDDPKMPTLLEVWPSVLYQEQEEYDLMGILFEGHPRMERLLLPETYEGIPPLRKEFKVKTEGINV